MNARALFFVMLVIACQRHEVVTGETLPDTRRRFAMGGGVQWYGMPEPQTYVHAPPPNRTVDYRAVPLTPWSSECSFPFHHCGHVYRTEFRERTVVPELDRVGRIAYMSSFSNGATLVYAAPLGAWPRHTSRMFVQAGDVIPTRHGWARVVELRAALDESYDDDVVTLDYVNPDVTEPPWLLYVTSTGICSLGDMQLAITEAWHGVAEVAMNVEGHETRTLVSKGDTLETPVGYFPVLDVVDGREPGPLGWVTIDTRSVSGQ